MEKRNLLIIFISVISISVLVLLILEPAFWSFNLPLFSPIGRGLPPDTIPVDELTGPSFYLVGNEELVFDWSTQHCEELDIPDIPAHAFRDAEGVVNLISSHITTRRLIGNSLNSVARDPVSGCEPVMTSTRNISYSDYRYNEWLSSTYTLDGQTIVGLIHNEWYGNLIHSPGCIGDQDCWVNAITMVTSSDRGAHYSHPTSYKVLVPPVNWSTSYPIPTIYGNFTPSNIFQMGNYYYTMFQSEIVPNTPDSDSGACLMRTNTLMDSLAWEVWTLSGWNTSETAVCKVIDRPNIEKMHESITYNTYLGAYVLVGYKFHHGPENNQIGVFYSLSSDLFNWTESTKVFDDDIDGDNIPDSQYAYPSLLDPEDTTRNFENTGQEAYIYFVRFNGGLDRDLLRQKIRFCRQGELCELCGNNIIDANEQCDDGNLNYCDGCSGQCRNEFGFCGDGECCYDFPNRRTETPENCGTDCVSSFLAGTKITTDNNLEKNIEKIKVGDLVLSFNEKTSSLTKSKVLQVFEHDADGYYIINGKIKVTAEHPIWVNGEWKKVRELKIGDALMTKDKTYAPIYSISYVEEKIKVYNLKVEDTQTYFAEGVLVHNKPPDPCQELCEQRTIPSYFGERCSRSVCESFKWCRFVDTEGGQCLPDSFPPR